MAPVLAATSARSAAAVTSGTNTLIKPAVQMVGSDGTNGVYWEMNPATTNFGVPQKLDELVPPGSGWSGIAVGLYIVVVCVTPASSMSFCRPRIASSI